jgi:uncharacterized Zn finger protein
LEIWKGISEGKIALREVKAYQEAARYLKKIQKLYSQQGKEKDWEGYAAHIRQANIRKPRFVEILDAPSEKRIVDG